MPREHTKVGLSRFSLEIFSVAVRVSGVQYPFGGFLLPFVAFKFELPPLFLRGGNSLLFSIFVNSHDAIIGTIAGYLIFAMTQWLFHLATGKIGMGQGDYKLLAALGAFLGWQMLPIIILLASISGIIFTLTHMAIKHQFKSTPLPFGPYLALAGWISLMWGNEILRLYLHAVH